MSDTLWGFSLREVWLKALTCRAVLAIASQTPMFISAENAEGWPRESRPCGNGAGSAASTSRLGVPAE